MQAGHPPSTTPSANVQLTPTFPSLLPPPGFITSRGILVVDAIWARELQGMSLGDAARLACHPACAGVGRLCIGCGNLDAPQTCVLFVAPAAAVDYLRPASMLHRCLLQQPRKATFVILLGTSSGSGYHTGSHQRTTSGHAVPTLSLRRPSADYCVAATCDTSAPTRVGQSVWTVHWLLVSAFELIV